MQDRSDKTHTVDGVEIAPGLWIWDNNLDSRQVDPEQFPGGRTHSPITGVGGEHWDGWYNTLGKDGRRAGLSNGERMIAVYEGVKASDHPGMAFGDVRAAQEQAAREAAGLHVRVILDLAVPADVSDDPEYVLAMVKDLVNPRFRRPLPNSVVVDVSMDVTG
jgi:hypothetical protein